MTKRFGGSAVTAILTSQGVDKEFLKNALDETKKTAAYCAQVKGVPNLEHCSGCDDICSTAVELCPELQSVLDERFQEGGLEL